MSSGSSRSSGTVGRPLSSDRMLKLMAYADGELEGAERLEVEGWLSTDVDAVRFVNELAGLGDLVKTGHEASADAKAVAAFDITNAVMAAVKEEKKDDAPQREAKVVPLDGARRQTNRRVGGFVAAALALAASVFLMTRHKEDQPIARTPVQAAEPIASAGAEPGVDVDVVETEGDSVRVFYLSSESSPTTSVVVWVDESGGK